MMSKSLSFRFSDIGGIKNADDEEWFDPFLDLDTALFVDPFLIFGNEVGLFDGAHDEIISFFTYIFKQIAESGGNTVAAKWIKSIDCLRFPEMEELCLGFSAEGTQGAGSGIDIARQIGSAIWTAIKSGTKELSHFEEIQIFEKGIGPDRISDATVRILLYRFARYTQEICRVFSVKTEKVIYSRSRFDVDKGLWLAEEFLLPRNKYNNKPILLCPKRYLRPLPTINSDDFWRYCQEHETTAIASLFGSEVSSKMPKEEIVKLALKFPRVRESYLKKVEAEESEPYDFEFDPRGFIKWYKKTAEWAEENNPVLSFNNKDDFYKFAEAIARIFQNYIENQGGWSLLWNENETPKREDASQRLFVGIVSHICAYNDIDLSREANIGRGPVDFKISSGFSRRALLEMKLAKNTKFWDGLAGQLPLYLKAEEVDFGLFLVIVYTDKDLLRIEKIEQRVAEVNEKLPYEIRAIVIDARNHPPSASNIKAARDLFS